MGAFVKNVKDEFMLSTEHSIRNIKAIALDGNKHNISSITIDLWTSKANSKYNNPGNMETNVITGIATTSKSVARMKRLIIIAIGPVTISS